jgi:hypothetical protein
MPVGISPSAPGTPDIVVMSSTDNPSPETIQTEFRNAGELRAEFDSLHNTLKTEALSFNKSADKFVSHLKKMQALLSQRGTERLRGEAGLPKWTPFLKDFAQEVGLSVSLRTLYRWLAPKPDPGTVKEKPRAPKKPSQRFQRGITDAAAMYRSMLVDVLDRVEKHREDPMALMRMVTEYREALAAEGVPPKIPPAVEPKPKQLTGMQKLKLADKHVARAVKNGTNGKLIK